MTDSTIFRAVDRAVFVAALTDRLRSAGVEVGLSSANRFGRALGLCAPTDETTLYWVARTCLIHDRTDLNIFDDVFSAIYLGGGLAIGRRQPERGQTIVKTTGTVVRESTTMDGIETMAGRIRATARPVVIDESDRTDERLEELVLPDLMPSSIAELAHTPFDQLSAEERDKLGHWLDEIASDFATRRTRRHRRAKHSESIDRRPTLKVARSTGGEPIRLARRRPRRKPRRIVMPHGPPNCVGESALRSQGFRAPRRCGGGSPAPDRQLPERPHPQRHAGGDRLPEPARAELVTGSAPCPSGSGGDGVSPVSNLG